MGEGEVENHIMLPNHSGLDLLITRIKLNFSNSDS